MPTLPGRFSAVPECVGRKLRLGKRVKRQRSVIRSDREGRNPEWERGRKVKGRIEPTSAKGANITPSHSFALNNVAFRGGQSSSRS